MGIVDPRRRLVHCTGARIRNCAAKPLTSVARSPSHRGRQTGPTGPASASPRRLRRASRAPAATRSGRTTGPHRRPPNGAPARRRPHRRAPGTDGTATGRHPSAACGHCCRCRRRCDSDDWWPDSWVGRAAGTGPRAVCDAARCAAERAARWVRSRRGICAMGRGAQAISWVR